MIKRTDLANVLLWLVLIVSFPASAQSSRYLLAISKTEHTLALVNPDTLQIVAKLSVGPNPHEVVASADGRFAYVSNPGNNDLHQIDVLDLVNRKTLPALDTSPLLAPHGMQYRQDELWFTAQGSKAIGRINLHNRQLEWVMGTGQDFTHLIYVSDDAQHIYTTNALSGTVSIFEHQLKQPTVPPSGKLPPTAKPYWDWQQRLVKVDKGSEGFDVAPDGTEVWTVSPQGVISIIDPSNASVITTVQTDIEGAHRLKFTSDGSKVVVVSVKTGAVVYFNRHKRQEISRVKLPPGDTILMDDINNRLFVSCPLDNIVAVVDNNSMRVISTFNVGGRPDGLALVDVPQPPN